MSFSVKIKDSGLFPVVVLKDEKNETEIELYSFGAILNSFVVSTAGGKRNIIDGFDSPEDAQQNITNGFKSAKLSPFVCRMQNGEYLFDTQHHKIKKIYLGNEAIHGLLFDALFNITHTYADDNSAEVFFKYEYHRADEGFPFPYSCEVRYVLTEGNKLNIQTIVVNNDTRLMPVADGWHPYFSIGENVDDLLVQFNSNNMVEFGEGLLPTGNMVAYPAFENMQHFGNTVLDNCFVLKDDEAPACILQDGKSGIRLTIKAGASYPYLQVYTPGHRKSIAIENLSSVPDAFNNGRGLLVAKPGDIFSFSTSYIITLL